MPVPLSSGEVRFDVGCVLYRQAEVNNNTTLNIFDIRRTCDYLLTLYCNICISDYLG